MLVEKTYSSQSVGVAECSSRPEGVLLPALTDIRTSDSWLLNSGPSNLSQAIPTYPRLSQQFLEKNRLFNFGLRLCAWDTSPLREAVFRSLRKPNVSYCRLRKTPGGDSGSNCLFVLQAYASLCRVMQVYATYPPFPMLPSLTYPHLSPIFMQKEKNDCA
jgi:hypothetical protein